MTNDKQSKPKKEKSVRNLFLAAILTLMLTTGILLFLEYSGISYKLFVGLVVAILVGVCLALLASLFLRSSSSAWWMTILHFILLPLAGIFIMGAGYLLVMIAPEQNWQLLPAPPEKAVRFMPDSKLNIFGETIRIQSASDKIYELNCVTYQSCEWSDVSSKSSTNDQSEDIYTCPDSVKPVLLLQPPLFIKPLDTLQVRSCGPDYEIQTKFALLNDGRILVSNRFWSVYDIFGIFSFAIIGFLGGIATSIATLVIRKRKAKESKLSTQL